MPAKHPFVSFMESIDVNLERLFDDGSGMRAGSHALHAMAVLLEIRKKFDASDTCMYACCIRPERHLNVGLTSNLAK